MRNLNKRFILQCLWISNEITRNLRNQLTFRLTPNSNNNSNTRACLHLQPTLLKILNRRCRPFIDVSRMGNSYSSSHNSPFIKENKQIMRSSIFISCSKPITSERSTFNAKCPFRLQHVAKHESAGLDWKIMNNRKVPRQVGNLHW